MQFQQKQLNYIRRLLIWSKSIHHLVQRFNCTFMLRLFTKLNYWESRSLHYQSKTKILQKTRKPPLQKKIGLGLGWMPGRPGSSYNLASYLSTLCTHCSSKYGDSNVKIVKFINCQLFIYIFWHFYSKEWQESRRREGRHAPKGHWSDLNQSTAFSHGWTMAPGSLLNRVS